MRIPRMSAQPVSHTLHCPIPFSPKILIYPLTVSRSWDLEPCTPFLGSTQPTSPNGISIESAIFPQCMLVTNGQTDRPTDDGIGPMQPKA